ncbi:MAG: hypothetical protein HY286_07395 [Planctomycetes bacterium]|nr:hypothetical protein [Planctomycetota bacterium]
MRKSLIIIIVTLLAGAAAGGGAVWYFIQKHEAAEHGDAHDKESSKPASRSQGPGGEPVLHLDAAGQRAAGVVVSAIRRASSQREAAAYGRLEEDPARSFTIRAPLGGTVGAAAAAFPKIGDPLAAGTVIATLTPRLAPLDRADLVTKTAAARADRAALDPQLSQARVALERAKKLNADDKNISDRAVEEAQAKVGELEARAAGADTALHWYENLTKDAAAGAGAFASLPLICMKDGEVVEVLSRPGEAVEAGQAILRISKFDHLLARVELRAGETIDNNFKAARFRAAGDATLQFSGVKIGAASSGDRAAIAAVFLFDCDAGALPLRPGLSVVAALPASGGAREGWILPRDAVVRALGKAWVYIQIGKEEFARREAKLEDATDDGWIALSGFDMNDKLVTAGAREMLSEELKAILMSDVEGGDKESAEKK